MATIEAVASRGAERSLPPVKYSGGHSAARPDSTQPAATPQDVVHVSDAARSLARSKGADQAAELQLSPKMLRELMATPKPRLGTATETNRVEL